jgi:hypothetical protein
VRRGYSDQEKKKAARIAAEATHKKLNADTCRKEQACAATELQELCEGTYANAVMVNSVGGFSAEHSKNYNV